MLQCWPVTLQPLSLCLYGANTEHGRGTSTSQTCLGEALPKGLAEPVFQELSPPINSGLPAQNPEFLT